VSKTKSVIWDPTNTPDRPEAIDSDVPPSIHDPEADCIVDVSAPSRLHFGLFSFGRRDGRQFGGVGVMVERPAVRLRIVGSRRFGLTGPLAERAAEFGRRWADFCGTSDPLPCRIEIRSAALQHVGLGVGTQLGLSVAAGLNTFFGLPLPSPAELAISVGRGLRSAVGTYGFAEGGLVVERGKLPRELIAPLDMRLGLPERWRFVLIHPRAGRGLWGEEEQKAFEHLPAVPGEVTDELTEEVRDRMLPAAARGRFELFSESVYRYGRVAGMCFAEIQGGPYNGRRLTELVEQVRSMGVSGVGQSSWGPTLFAILPDQTAAEDFAANFAARIPDDDIELSITRASSRGATIVVRHAPSGNGGGME